MIVLALDPGTRETGWAVVDTDGSTVKASGKDANLTVRQSIVDDTWSVELVLIESMNGAHAGMPFGVEKIEAVRWAGRFEEAACRWDHLLPDGCSSVLRISREEVKRVLLGSPAVRGADAVMRAWLIDHFAAIAGDPLGGRRVAVGSKAEPGPLFGVKADAWSAVALAIAHGRGADDITTERAKSAERRAAKAAGTARRIA